jgi:hypothetical protein
VSCRFASLLVVLGGGGGGGGGGGRGVLQFGRWCLLAFYGAYGKKGTMDALRIWRGLSRTFYPRVFIFCIFGH